ncbi:MAG TPA: BTAD domain-containing putative transcriptional regulator [Gemmatimonadales bacterium]|jgi:DNA-binding SARP family transcriptional activator/tetratricopeptide (TPR) repeat protein|nr:BTAD domain-containing putative transcriptional regulator [Gemmatimonadales bacterium]
MIELTLLGLHALRSPDGRDLSSLPAQPKRFALLAYLAIGGAGYHRRDSLAAMFWPDLDQFAARRALRNTLYHLREALGDGVIISQGDDAVAIDPALLTCDVIELGRAVESARYEAAVDGYRGELLAGVHFANAGEAFEEWLSRERLRVAALVMRALEALADREQRAGNLAAAAHWAQRACAMAPDDERWLRRGMSLLDESSNTGDALRLYETYARRLATEFDARPSAETEALVGRIRSGKSKVSAPPDSALRVPAPTAPAQPAPVPVRHRRRTAMLVSLTGVLAIISAVVFHTIRRDRTDRITPRTRVLVAVFDNRTGDSALKSLGRMAQDWLAQGLTRIERVDLVDPRAVFVQSRSVAGDVVDPLTLARRTGAAMAVSGSYYRSGDTLLLQATLTDVRTGRMVRVVGPILSNVAAPVAALDELRSRVMTALASVIDAHATQDLVAADAPTFDAYQAYVQGWDAFWHGDGRRAETLFVQAAHRDTAFTAAAMAAAVAAANSNDCPVVDSLTRALDARSRPLGRVDQLSLQIANARCHGRNDEMLRLTLERADLEPGNAADQMAAAAAALWANRLQRALALFRRVNPATDLEWNTDTTHVAYWGGVTDALHGLGRHREELAEAERLSTGAPLTRISLRASALAALSRPTAALVLLDSAMELPVETASDLGLAPYTDGRPQYTMTPAWIANWVSRELAVHGDTVASRQAAIRAVAWYRRRPAEERATFEERLVAAWSLEMMGDFAEAERIARQLVAEDSTNVDSRGELAGLAAEQGDTVLADSLDRWLAAQPVARVGWAASDYRARLAALLGRPDSAMARLRDAFDEGIWPRWLHQEPALNVLRSRPDFVALTAPRN